MRLKEHWISARAAHLLATTPGLSEGDAEARAAFALTSAGERRRHHALELQHVDRNTPIRRRMDHPVLGTTPRAVADHRSLAAG